MKQYYIVIKIIINSYMPIIINDYFSDYWMTSNLKDCGKTIKDDSETNIENVILLDNCEDNLENNLIYYNDNSKINQKKLNNYINIYYNNTTYNANSSTKQNYRIDRYNQKNTFTSTHFRLKNYKINTYNRSINQQNSI